MLFLDNLLVELVIAILEVVVFSLVVKRLLDRREARRWMPFRRYLLQALHDQTGRALAVADELFRDLRTKMDATPARPNLVDELVARLESAATSLRDVRHNVHQAIQTAAPSLTSTSAIHFTNLFRALDNGPLLCDLLARELRSHEGSGDGIQAKVAREAIKILGGVSVLTEDVDTLIRHEGYTVLEGTVCTPEDIERRQRIEATIQEVKRRSGTAGT